MKMEIRSHQFRRRPQSPPDSKAMARLMMDMLHDAVVEESGIHEPIASVPQALPATVRVLFIESSPYDLGLNEEFLGCEQSGIELHRTMDVTDACEQVQGGGMDVILLDLSHIARGDYDLIRQIKQAQPGIPIVAMIGIGQDPNDFRAAGCHGSVIKPFVTSRVLDRIVRTSFLQAQMN